MDDVILNDIPIMPHIHYVQWVDLAFVVVMLVATAVVFFLSSVIMRWLCNNYAINHLNRYLVIIKNKVSTWLNNQNIFNKIRSILGTLCQICLYLLLTILVFCSIASIFDKVFGIDSTYRKIVAKYHFVSREDIYSVLGFVEPDVALDTCRILEYVYSSDSIPNDDLRSQIDSLYKASNSNNTFIKLYYLSSMNDLPTYIQDFFFKQALLKARNKYETLNPILQRYIVTDDLHGMLAIDSLAKSWRWELGFYENRFWPQDYLRTKCLYYVVQLLERDFPVTDSVAQKLFKYSCEGYETSCRLTDNYSYICLFFQDVRARYAYQIHNSQAAKYADKLIENSRRWKTPFSINSFLISPDRGGDVPGYYNRFFTDPLFLRYKSLLKERKYKKAALALEVMSSITEDMPSDPDNPYINLHDTLQPQNASKIEDIVAYAKYDLASISENARIRRLMKQKSAEDWMVGTYLTGVSYLSPTESVFGSLNDYAFQGNLYFSDLIPYMSINYNNTDSRWVYNTALFLKGTGASISSLIEESVSKSNNDVLKTLLSTLKTERVFSNETYPKDKRFIMLDSLLSNTLGYRIKDVLSDCFHSYLDVQKALSNNECAIEIVKAPSLDFSDDSYKAVVLRNNMPRPIIVDLAPASIINEAISSSNLYGNGSTKIYSLIWKPLERYVRPNDTIFIAPDGVLCSINIAALSDFDDHQIMERYDIRQCVSTKTAVRRHGGHKYSSIALFGGIIYDEITNQDVPHPQNTYLKAYRGIDCNSRGDGWRYLPGTKTEVENINSTALSCGLSSTLFTGRKATEYKFKSISGHDIDILHIATHGFYYNKAIASDLTFFEKMILNSNPLNRCGLIMAGGQRAWLGEDTPSSEEDGVLLGSEIARMDLSKVDIVVLSACNTGLGDITYEGVSGLQRAFKQAGVNNIIMTLNFVDDRATIALMNLFYDNLFSGMEVSSAFTHAINKMKKDAVYGKSEYWAPFVLIN